MQKCRTFTTLHILQFIKYTDIMHICHDILNFTQTGVKLQKLAKVNTIKYRYITPINKGICHDFTSLHII